MISDISSDTPSIETTDSLLLGGFPVLSITPSAFVASLYRNLTEGRPQRVFFANTNFVVQCQSLRIRMYSERVCILNDGIGMDLAAWLIHGRRFVGNLNGTDLIPYLCKHTPRPLRFFLLGAKPGVADAAAQTLCRLGQLVVGTCDGYAQFAASGEHLVEFINASSADVLLVALGSPLQERWILDHDVQLHTPVVFAVGALFDFMSGSVQRAPLWVRRVHGEWLYRLLREPRRLFKRYSWDVFRFFHVCLLRGKRLN
ncbi:WecB/TagA/CpsF family glycosyltransferase [Xylella taiwanensis]|nr:WecB/TagA/CpsF family glycosyltransferase [Xylella taiwanensis]AXI83283.1 polysaccharide biosynthesis protein GumM [Xylella taiwanensis]MCD8456350.1 WecB/TagA/CpsF family glycosyltransferase [Xylella taiwanensis]MCD8458758.1 WecB/TagA/CpsF family glycosyltransferase [Xylella taiwanensis]MCD8460894.1 WecB/TagA/CpsF family glycosyltransferase [Xylella taiwanensis]MCD8463047.1 WecB/TagA/CpsF family glycosyltransferase [Xylella taiwanensis]